MFALNLGYRWTLANEVDSVDSIVYLPCSNQINRMHRIKGHPPSIKRVLFDPQLYLSTLDSETCTKFCARLATYSWFGVTGLPEFDDTKNTQTDWAREVQSVIPKLWPGSPVDTPETILQASTQALDFQQSLGCSHMILPTPLITEREDEADTQAKWLDAGIAAAGDLDLGQPLIATVALEETTLSPGAFDENGFLDIIVDQVTAREELDGVYIVVAQTHARHPFETSVEVCRAYLHLSQAFAKAGLDNVIVNFCDVFSLACTAVGATGFATGQSQALRRLSLAGFEDSRGKAFPSFYSHRLLAELRSETDLDRIVQHRLLRRVRDLTPHSRALMKELDQGGSAANVQAWLESQNNVKAAHKHFLYRIAKTAMETGQLPMDERQDRVQDWLETAIANNLLVSRRMEEEPLKGRVAPSEMWLSELERSLNLSDD